MNRFISVLKKKKFEILLFCGMCTIYFFSYFQRVGIPGTIFNDIQSDMHISASEVTALGAIFLYVYAGMQMIIGILADKYGGMKVLITGTVIMCAGSLIFPLSHNISMLYAGRAITGLGASSMYLCVVKEIDRLFGAKNFSLVGGMMYFIGYAGGLFATMPFERAAAFIGWRTVLIWIAIASIVTLIFLILMLKKDKTPAHHALSSFRLSKIPGLFKSRYYTYILICAALNYGIYFILQTIVGKKFLEDYTCMSSYLAGTVTFIMMGASMLTAVLSGTISRIFGNRRKIFVVGATGTTFISSIMLIGGTLMHFNGYFFLVCYVLLAASAGCGTVLVAAVRETGDPDGVAVSIGVVNCSLYLFIAVFSNIAGWLMNHYEYLAVKSGTNIIYPQESYLSIFILMLILGALSFGVSFLTKETNGNFIKA